MGGGFRFNCTQACPFRRGLRRGYVAEQLVRGHIVDGVHPRSHLIMEAQARLMLNAQSNAADIQALQDQVAELQNRIRWLEQRRHEIRTMMLGLALLQRRRPRRKPAEQFLSARVRASCA